MNQYQRKLSNPLWQRKRLEIYQRDNFSCVKCGDNKTELQVHHKYYEKGKEPYEHEDDAMATLCANCHEVISSFKKLVSVDIFPFPFKKIIFDDGRKQLFIKNRNGKYFTAIFNADDEIIFSTNYELDKCNSYGENDLILDIKKKDA